MANRCADHDNIPAAIVGVFPKRSPSTATPSRRPCSAARRSCSTTSRPARPDMRTIKPGERSATPPSIRGENSSAAWSCAQGIAASLAAEFAGRARPATRRTASLSATKSVRAEQAASSAVLARRTGYPYSIVSTDRPLPPTAPLSKRPP